MRGAPPRPTAAAARPRPCEGPIEARFASRHMIKRGLLPLPTHQPPLTPLRRPLCRQNKVWLRLRSPSQHAVWPHTAAEPPRARRGGSTSIRSSCAPACCRARINCAPRASGRLSSTKRRARGSSATSSRQAWPQAAAVARGARAWLREWVNMRVVASSAPVMSLRVAHHHFARRAASEYSRHFSTTMRSSGS